jgi:hypothetical protein
MKINISCRDTRVNRSYGEILSEVGGALLHKTYIILDS